MKQPEDNFTTDIEDIILWPNGTWCYRYELHEMNYMSDDFQVLQFDSPEYRMFLEANT